MKDLLKNAFPLYGIVASTLKILKSLKIQKKLVFTGRNLYTVDKFAIISSLKLDFSQVSVLVSTSRKKLEIIIYELLFIIVD